MSDRGGHRRGFAARMTGVGLVLAIAIAAVAALPGGSAHAADAEKPALSVQSVNASSYPRIQLRVSLPPDWANAKETPSFTVRENGAKRSVLDAQPILKAERAPIDVVLILDASGSMEGTPLREARSAAGAFVASMGAADRVAVLAIGEQPQLLTDFTTDRTRLAAAIGSVQAKGETALYDTLVRAGSLLGGSTARSRYVVLLSDGGDTLSSASLNDAVKAVTARTAPVYAVALVSPEYKPAAVSTLSRSTQGRMLSASQAAELTGLFRQIAAEIQTAWMVTYESADPPTADLEIAVSAASGERELSALTVVDNPSFGPGAGEAAPRALTLGMGYLVAAKGIAIAIGIAVALLATGVALLLRKEGTALEQLSFYNKLRSEGTAGERASRASGDESVRERLQTMVDHVAGGHGVRADFKRRLDQANLKMRPDEFMYFHLLGTVAVGVGVRVVSGSTAATAVALLFAALGPIVYLDMKASRRRARFDAQLPDIVSLISGSLRAGWGIQQALELIIGETGEPAAAEFARVQSETRLGLSLEEALDKMAQRVGSEDFRWVVSAIAIQREVGGNLAEVLDIAVGTIRERAELRREVKALTAEGRFSAVVLVALPFILLAGLSIIAPKYLNSMTGSTYGLFALAFAAVLLAIGAVWMYRISKVEV